MALHHPTTEQWLIYGSCLEARQPSTRIIHETVLRKVGQEYIYISYLVAEMGNKIAMSA